MMPESADRRIIEGLVAPQKMHRRLVRTAKRVSEILLDSGDVPLAASAELYGSLALDIGTPVLSHWKQNKQDWASYYVTERSDIDFVVNMSLGVKPAAVVERLMKKGHWRMLGRVRVSKFASTQFTLLGRFDDEDSEDEGFDDDGKGAPNEASVGAEGEQVREGSATSEVYLDITCVDKPKQFKRFKKRLAAFYGIFSDARAGVEDQFGAQGSLAFDAYIHLLKAFAAKVPGNFLTGHQAVCIGLFSLQIGHFILKPTHSIALSFFEGFLRFCLTFYGESPGSGTWNYRHLAIDLSMGGRWLPRMSTDWKSELYFMQAEESMNIHADERVNVTHSLEPACVCSEAYAVLQKSFAGEQSPLLFGST